ncbi:MAG: right-handed parallel beta-helix repeat-containing protein, partial [Candidatus Bathyarchaeota archaeon]
MKKRYVLLGILILYGFLFVFPNTIVGEQRYVVLLQGESTSISGYISEDTTWTVAGSPYIIVGGVIVNPGAILTIESGVVVRFTAGTNLVIDGGLIAQGNATNRIMFTSNATAPAPGDWAGILIRSSGFCNVASSVIKYATCGINFDHPETSAFTQSRVTSNVVGIEIFGHRVRLEGLTIENNTDCGIYGNTGYIPIRNSMISKNNIGIKGNGASANINNCTISNNTLDGIYSGWIMHIDGIWDSHIVNNGGWGINIGARLRNCRDTTISNNSGGGVYVYNYWSAEIYSCNITNNNGHGVFSSGEWGGGVTITGSIISNNRNYGV